MTAGPLEATGPCEHDVVDDVCSDCTIDRLWRIINEQRPTKHLQGELATRAFGARRYLAEAALRLQPLRYLEVGVRRGHSLALVSLAAEVLGGELEYAVGVDAWIDNYAGEPNNADDVYELLADVGAPWSELALMTGDSHELLPALKAARRFNLIFVDGDHTEEGARQDLADAFELLEPGGELVFDDAVAAGGDNRLLQVWRQWVTLSSARPAIAATGEQLEDRPAFCWLVKGGA